MCGIAGYVGFEDKPLLRRMCDVQAHRGPDDEGQFHGVAAGLGNRRLAIVDIAGGHQPIPNEDESVWITYNGEVYNHHELRAELETLGHRFRTRSDTEVLVHAYEAWGDDFASRLNGIFAAAIWDARRNRLVLTRDPLGVKPLHYTFVDGGLLFASEMKALLQHDGVRRRLNRRALKLFLHQFYVPGEETFLEGVQRLKPAHQLAWEAGKVTTRRYWMPAVAPEDRPEEHWIEATRNALEASVRRELQGEVPIGVMLSGGMDSTTLVALMSRHWKDPIHTYTVNFGTDEDEGADARMVAEHFGTRHHELTYDNDEGLRRLPEILWHMEEPRMQAGPTFFLAQTARAHVKVLLSGIGGDEFYLGYQRDLNAVRRWKMPRYVPRAVRSAVSRLPMPTDRTERMRNFVAAADDPPSLYEAFAPTGPLTSREERDVLGDGLLLEPIRPSDAYRPYFEAAPDVEFPTQALLVQMHTYLPDDILLIADRMLAAHSVEGRVPFCNKDVVELSFRIPHAMKAARQKHILRSAMRRILPDAIVQNMRKRVFGAPMWHWYETGMRDVARRLLTPARLEKHGYFRPEWVTRMLDRPVDRSREREYAHLWNILSFDVWHRVFLEGDPRARPGALSDLA